jgi:hypothetical protein
MNLIKQEMIGVTVEVLLHIYSLRHCTETKQTVSLSGLINPELVVPCTFQLKTLRNVF